MRHLYPNMCFVSSLTGLKLKMLTSTNEVGNTFQKETNGWQGLFQEEAGPKRDRYRFSLQRMWEPDRNTNREPNMKARRLAVAAVAFAVVKVCTDLPAHAQSVLGEPVSGSLRKY